MKGVPADSSVAAPSPGGDFGKSRWQLCYEATSKLVQRAISPVGRCCRNSLRKKCGIRIWNKRIRKDGFL